MNTQPTLATLVSSNDVTGTKVFSPDGDHIGEIDHIMIDKLSGKIVYVVMTFGGFLGIGEDQHSLPWPTLKYDPDKGGYVANVTREMLEASPPRQQDWATDRRWEERLHGHYGIPPYWA